MREFLIAHTCPSGASAAQATVPAKTLAEATTTFTQAHPDRVITATGIKGSEG